MLEMARELKTHPGGGCREGGSSKLEAEEMGTRGSPDQTWGWLHVGVLGEASRVPSPRCQAMNCKSDSPREQGVGVLNAPEGHQDTGGKWHPHTPNTRSWCHRRNTPGTRANCHWGWAQPHRQANRKFQTQRQVHSQTHPPVLKKVYTLKTARQIY